MYRSINSSGVRAVRIGGLLSMFLSESSASCASRVHVKWSDFFISLYSGRLRSPSRAMERLRVARQPDTLYTLQVLDQSHAHDGRYLLRVRLDAAFRHDKAKEHTPWNPENALLGVQLYPMLSQLCNDLDEVRDQVSCPP
jgi:hypothetical protein